MNKNSGNRPVSIITFLLITFASNNANSENLNANSWIEDQKKCAAQFIGEFSLSKYNDLSELFVGPQGKFSPQEKEKISAMLSTAHQKIGEIVNYEIEEKKPDSKANKYIYRTTIPDLKPEPGRFYFATDIIIESSNLGPLLLSIEKAHGAQNCDISWIKIGLPQNMSDASRELGISIKQLREK